jgi:transcriptional regulator with XRE-family HTH domain
MHGRRNGEAFGGLLQSWRKRRRLSQLELASLAGVSTRHLSFLETGRSRPSRELVLHLAGNLDVPLRERNRLLLAAGFAPTYPETSIDAPEMDQVREAVDLLMGLHDPYPALVMNRRFDLVAANRSFAVITEGIEPHLLEPPVNVIRAALHPNGLARRVVNLGEFRDHLLTRLKRDVLLTGDEELGALYEEAAAYPLPAAAAELAVEAPPAVVLPIRLRSGNGELAFFSIVATFGTPIDITVAELAIESFFPADRATESVLRARAAEWQKSTAGVQPLDQPPGGVTGGAQALRRVPPPAR